MHLHDYVIAISTRTPETHAHIRQHPANVYIHVYVSPFARKIDIRAGSFSLLPLSPARKAQWKSGLFRAELFRADFLLAYNRSRAHFFFYCAYNKNDFTICGREIGLTICVDVRVIQPAVLYASVLEEVLFNVCRHFSWMRCLLFDFASVVCAFVEFLGQCFLYCVCIVSAFCARRASYAKRILCTQNCHRRFVRVSNKYVKFIVCQNDIVNVKMAEFCMRFQICCS